MKKNDINKEALNDDDTEIVIGVEFGALPLVITIDAINSTTLDDEYLLNSSGNLTIIAGVNDIPINKHGSGVKRLVLLIFFSC